MSNSFRTEIELLPHPVKLNHPDPILTIGSCFSDTVGQKLKENKFKVTANPFGTTYNPLSIFRHIHRCISCSYPPENSYALSQGLYCNLHFHSSFNNVARETVQKQIEQAIDTAHNKLSDTKWLVITLGTAWAFKEINTGDIVANCHKIPMKNFTRELMSVDEITDSFHAMHRELLAANPHIKLILTVSPVRHLKDGLEGNTISKSILRLACDKITKAFSNVTYFPSYEIMLDDLRDYRFYKRDFIHPSEEAVDYIWESFAQAYFSRETRQLLKEWEGLQKSIAHRPFNPKSETYHKFLLNTLEKINQLNGPLDLQDELTQWNERINTFYL